MKSDHKHIVNNILNQILNIPTPNTEYKFSEDPELKVYKRRFRFDFAYPKEKIAIEIEGGIWVKGRHTRGEGFIRDMEKYNIATAHLWHIIRIPAHEINKLKWYNYILKLWESKNV